MANENENGNGNKPPDTKIEEPVYIMAPHPAAVVVSTEETITPDEPEVAEETLSDMIQQAVDGLRSELKAEIQQELKGGSELNVKG
jgi:hypothetical protein